MLRETANMITYRLLDQFWDTADLKYSMAVSIKQGCELDRFLTEFKKYLLVRVKKIISATCSAVSVPKLQIRNHSIYSNKSKVKFVLRDLNRSILGTQWLNSIVLFSSPKKSIFWVRQKQSSSASSSLQPWYRQWCKVTKYFYLSSFFR